MININFFLFPPYLDYNNYLTRIWSFSQSFPISSNVNPSLAGSEVVTTENEDVESFLLTFDPPF